MATPPFLTRRHPSVCEAFHNSASVFIGIYVWQAFRKREASTRAGSEIITQRADNIAVRQDVQSIPNRIE
jgi:hypothetical protein